jgi:hypothetical protein
MPKQTPEPENERMLLFEIAAQAGSSLLRHAAKIPNPFRIAEVLAQCWRRALEAQKDRTRYDPSLSRDLFYGFLDTEVIAEPSRSDVLMAVRNDLARAFDLHNELDEIERRAFDRVREFIAEWGGPATKARFSHLNALPVSASIAFQNKSAVAEFVRSKSIIEVRVGLVEDAVWDYLNLELACFHEHISHQLPGWREDQVGFSEGYLLAVELAWLERYSDPFDFKLVNRASFNMQRAGVAQDYSERAEWFLHRCGSAPECFARFLLEWAAQWDSLPSEIHADLESSLTGVFNKSAPRPRKAADLFSVREEFEKMFCGGCQAGWDIKSLTRKLAALMKRFEPPPIVPQNVLSS